MAEACVSLEEDTHLKNKTPKINLRKEIKIQMMPLVASVMMTMKQEATAAALPYHTTLPVVLLPPPHGTATTLR